MILSIRSDAPWKSSSTSAPCFSQASDQPPLSSVGAAAISSLAPLFLTPHAPTPDPIPSVKRWPPLRCTWSFPLRSCLQLIYQEEGEASPGSPRLPQGRKHREKRGGGAVRGAVEGRRMADFLFTLRRLHRQRSWRQRPTRGFGSIYVQVLRENVSRTRHQTVLVLSTGSRGGWTL